jgi:hypothetical protein
MYRPLRSTDGAFTAHGPMFVPLPPGEDVSLWTWTVGDDFNMSEPGTYRVSLGGRFAYLKTTVCSNTLEVNVEHRRTRQAARRCSGRVDISVSPASGTGSNQIFQFTASAAAGWQVSSLL